MRYAPATKSLMQLAAAICLLCIIMAGDTGLILYAGAEPLEDTPHPASIVIMTSPYMNEKGSIKAYHRELTLTFISWDNSTTKSYLIKADTIILAEGNFTEYKEVMLEPKQRIIREFKVYIDANLTLERKNMVLYNQDYYNAPDEGGGEFKFLGYTWSEIVAQRWLIFRAVLVGSLISLFILGRIFKHYWVKTRGEEIIVSSY